MEIIELPSESEGVLILDFLIIIFFAKIRQKYNFKTKKGAKLGNFAPFFSSEKTKV